MKSIDLFVMAGQSNMFGTQGDAKSYPPDHHDIDRNIRFYHGVPARGGSAHSWTHLQPQEGNFPLGHFGPEVGFARCLVESGYNPAIFKYSQGSTSLKYDWKRPGGNGMYDKMIRELKQATVLLEKDGCNFSLCGLVWIQGESDAQTAEMAGEYGQRLKSFITHFREKFAQNSQLPVILGVDEQHPLVKTNPQVIAHQQKLAEESHGIKFTSMEGLEKADTTHLTPAGLMEHGKRLCRAMIQLLEARETI